MTRTRNLRKGIVISSTNAWNMTYLSGHAAVVDMLYETWFVQKANRWFWTGVKRHAQEVSTD